MTGDLARITEERDAALREVERLRNENMILRGQLDFADDPLLDRLVLAQQDVEELVGRERERQEMPMLVQLALAAAENGCSIFLDPDDGFILAEESEA